MTPADAAIIFVLVITAGVSIAAFYQPQITERLIFRPDRILASKEYYRMVSSALLHADWFHLLLNCYVFWCFGLPIAHRFGPNQLGLIYLGSIIGGSLLALWVHRHHDYSALGASGGVCGVMFAYLFLFPGSGVSHYFIIPMPGWLYMVLFIVGSYYGIRTQRDNIGHDAHLGGAIVGLLITTALYPEIVRYRPLLYAVVLGLSVLVFLALIINPLHLPWKAYVNPGRRRTVPPPNPPVDNARLDAILEKISKSGLHSLTKAEQEYLRRASRK